MPRNRTQAAHPAVARPCRTIRQPKRTPPHLVALTRLAVAGLRASEADAKGGPTARAATMIELRHASDDYLRHVRQRVF